MFIERQDAFKEKKFAEHNYKLRDFFFLEQFALWLIFQPRSKCTHSPFLHFKHSTLFTAWVISGFVVRNCKISVQLSALFRKISPPLKRFTALKSCNILIFESSWLSIPTIFRFKVAEKSLQLSWNSLPWTFSLAYLKPIS